MFIVLIIIGFICAVVGHHFIDKFDARDGRRDATGYGSNIGWHGWPNYMAIFGFTLAAFCLILGPAFEPLLWDFAYHFVAAISPPR